jgi:3-hydroxyacyl-[acyl-carrier-protein] dehydratase
VKNMDIHRVLEYLPHRYPFLMIDRVLSCDPGKSVVALKNVTINEPYFAGHFPRHPVMPGVLIIEAIAQAAAILTFVTENHKPDDRMVYYFVGIDNARFKKPVVPGDQLELEVRLERSLRGIGKFGCVARVGPDTVAEATILCSVRPVDV